MYILLISQGLLQKILRAARRKWKAKVAAVNCQGITDVYEYAILEHITRIKVDLKCVITSAMEVMFSSMYVVFLFFFVGLSAGLHKNYWTDSQENLNRGWVSTQNRSH